MEATLIFLLLLIAGLIIVTVVRGRGSDSQTQKTPPLLPKVPLPDLSMLPLCFVVLDLETTGLSSATDEIIEFGAIRVNRDSDLHTSFQALVKPIHKIPRRITEITGISQAMVDKDGEPLRETLIEFLAFIEDLPLVAFNASFDMGFLKQAAKPHGLVINNHYSCALEMARSAWPGLPSYKLSELARRGNLSDGDTHRALGDCKRALSIYTAAASTLGVAG